MNRGLINGLFFGATTVVVGLALYLIDKPLFLNPGIRFVLSLMIPIVFMTKAGLEKRREQDGFVAFSEVLQPVYLTLVIGSLIYAVFQYIIMNMDPALLEIQKEIAVRNLESLAGLANLDEEQLADIREVNPEELKPSGRSMMMLVSKNFILGFIIAVVISLVIKRKNGSSEQS